MSSDSRRLSQQKLRAWEAMRLMSRRIDAQLARELTATSPLSMQDYDVLSTVVTMPERRMVMKDLMLHLQWSYSRLSHHLSRMESRNLVERVGDPGSNTPVQVTEHGYALIKAASGEHLRAVHRYFGEALEPGEAEMLEQLSTRILGGLPGPTPRRGW